MEEADYEVDRDNAETQSSPVSNSNKNITQNGHRRQTSDDGLNALASSAAPPSRGQVMRGDSGGLEPILRNPARSPRLSMLKQAPIGLMPMDIDGTADDISLYEPSIRSLHLEQDTTVALKDESEPNESLTVGISKYRRARSRSPSRDEMIDRVARVKEEMLSQSFSSFEPIEPPANTHDDYEVKDEQPNRTKEYKMELEDEEDATILKRKAIRAVMTDTSMDQAEKQQKMQDIMTGKVEPSSVVGSAPTTSNSGPKKEYVMELEDEEAATLARRKEIRAIMMDQSLDQQARQTKIQEIMSGKTGSSPGKKDAPKSKLKNAPKGVTKDPQSQPASSSLKKAPPPAAGGPKKPPPNSSQRKQPPPGAGRKAAPIAAAGAGAGLQRKDPPKPPPESARPGPLKPAAAMSDGRNQKMPAKSKEELLDSKMSPQGGERKVAAAAAGAATAPFVAGMNNSTSESSKPGFTPVAAREDRISRKMREADEGKSTSGTATGKPRGGVARGPAMAGVGAMAATGDDDPAAMKNKAETRYRDELFENEEGEEINVSDYLNQQVRATQEAQQKKGKKKDEDEAANDPNQKDGAAAVPQAPGAFSVNAGRGMFTGGYRQRERNRSRRVATVQDAAVDVVMQDNIDEDDFDCLEKLYAKADKPTVCVGICIVIFIITAISVPLTLNATKADPPTAAPTSARFFLRDDFLQAFDNITSAETFDDPDSAQSQALDWLLYDDEMMLMPDDKEAVERYLLMVTYFGNGGETWSYEDTVWGEGVNVCEWSYVVCEGSDVGALNLQAVGMTGTLESEITQLTKLSSLDISRNILGERTFPSLLVSMTNLEFLYLDDNNLRGTLPTTIGALTGLSHLTVGNNEFTGQLPAELSALTLLGVFEAYLNRFDDNLALDIAANWPELTRLDISNNKFYGTVSTRIGRLTNLRTLRIDSNDFRDALPTEIGNMQTLRRLNVAGNFRLTGTIPTQLARCTELRDLVLFDNRFSGTIPTEIGLLTNLVNFYATALELTGNIPSEMGSCTALTSLLLTNNELDGQVPTTLGSLTALEEMTVHFTDLTGSMPATICDLRRMSLSRLEADCFDLNAQLQCEKPDCCTICH